jgi:hypothetical protein
MEIDIGKACLSSEEQNALLVEESRGELSEASTGSVVRPSKLIERIEHAALEKDLKFQPRLDVSD